jgi:outer membrane protein assembly factor BamE
VRFLLGTPLLMDMFHADRWDYPFYLARGNGELTTSRVTVYFKDDVVERFEGGNLPTEREYIARIAGPAKNAIKEANKAEKAATARPVEPTTIATPATSTTTP